MTWEQAGHISSVLVDVTVLVAAFVAAVKLRVFRLLARRWHTDLECRHWVLAGGTVFEGSFAFFNRGQLSIPLERVDLQVLRARAEDGLFVPDEETPLATRTLSRRPDEAPLEVHSGERLLLPIRCQLPSGVDVLFVAGRFQFRGDPVPGQHQGFYCTAPVPPAPK